MRVDANDSNEWKLASRFKIYKKLDLRRRVFKLSSHSHLLYSFALRYNHLTVIHLQLCDCKRSLRARGFGLQRTWFTFVVNNFSGSGKAVVLSNCYQFAWISAVYRDRKWSLWLEEMAEIQASSQSPIFFRLVEDGDRCCQSDLGISVFWVSAYPNH